MEAAVTMGKSADVPATHPDQFVQWRARSIALIRLLNDWKWLAIFAGLFFAVFADVLLHDRNFIYRDAGHFYYPFFKMIAQQWGEGRIPLWNPYENGGVPLAANPTASVFYPLKILFALPFPQAYKWYLMGHIALAALNAFIACRGFGVSKAGSGLCAFAYAFSGDVLFQIYNIVFLCGAAWLPLGLLCVDRLVREPAWRWALGLGAVLALQVLGGDPEIAFVTGLLAVPYSFYFHHGAKAGTLLTAGSMAIGFGIVQFRLWYPDIVLAADSRLGWWSEVSAHPYYAAAVLIVPTIGVVLFALGYVLGGNKEGVQTAKLLVVAAVAGFLLSAVQVLPTLDLVRVSDRASPEAPHESAAFSFFPGRLPELVIPAVFGRQFSVNTRWAPFDRFENGIWVPSLYLGLVPLLLAGSLMTLRGPGLPRSLTILTIIAFWLAIGKYGGPLWIFDPNLGKAIDPVRVKNPSDIKLYGTSDGLYRVLEETVPGFRSFRYPAKMMVISVLAVSMLAGLGWDRLREQQGIRLMKVAAILATATLVLCLAVFLSKQWVMRGLQSFEPVTTSFGPFIPEAAWRHLCGSLLHCFLVASAFTLLLILRKRGVLAESHFFTLILLVVAADLYFATRWMILTDEQSIIDAKPEIVRVIEEEEAKEKSNAPYRVERTRIYEPINWKKYSNPERILEMSRWERKTIQPKYGLPFGIQYATTSGTMAIYDVEFFFAPWKVDTPPAILRGHKNMPNVLVYFPRRGFNMWNTKYFVLPRGHLFDHEYRGVLTMLATREGKQLPVLAESSPIEEDYMVLKNTEAFPRAWVVHRTESWPPLKTLRKRERIVPMERLLYREMDVGVHLWSGRKWGEYPLRSQAMIEYDGDFDLTPYQTGGEPRENEMVVFESYEADRIVMNATLQEAGFIVLADTFHEGWQATVDGHSVPVIRANRAMRAIPVPAGQHTVTLQYRSKPFEIGAAVSILSWILLALFAVALKFKRQT